MSEKEAVRWERRWTRDVCEYSYVAIGSVWFGFDLSSTRRDHTPRVQKTYYVSNAVWHFAVSPGTWGPSTGASVGKSQAVSKQLQHYERTSLHHAPEQVKSLTGRFWGRMSPNKTRWGESRCSSCGTAVYPWRKPPYPLEWRDCASLPFGGFCRRLYSGWGSADLYLDGQRATAISRRLGGK